MNIRLFAPYALAFGILNLAWALYSIRRGYFYAYLSTTYRVAEPFLFWLNVGFSLALGLMTVAGATAVLLGLWP